MQNAQTATRLFMVEPTSFEFDKQTAATNAFQHHLGSSSQQITQQALQEFHGYVETLRAHDIDVLVFRDTDPQPKPNAVFPNNWFTSWPDGTVYLYPMATPSRRLERSREALDLLRTRFEIKRVADLSPAEAGGEFLEGTGVLIFDHPARTVYACISPRCNGSLLTSHARTLGYKLVAFHGADIAGTPIYHTNVMLGVQSKTAVLYSEGITSKTERARVVESLENSGHEVIDINFEQLSNFCGNVLNVQNQSGEQFVLLSQAAFDAFLPSQRDTLSRSGQLLPVAIPTIETIGGGSARCMVAEVFLPAAVNPAS